MKLINTKYGWVQIEGKEKQYYAVRSVNWPVVIGLAVFAFYMIYWYA